MVWRNIGVPMSTNTEKEKAKTQEPGLKTLSQLMRLGNEQGLTDERLNYLLSSGVLARVFQVDPSKSINLIALERVLGLIDPLDEVRRPILVNHRASIDWLIKEKGIVIKDNRHDEIVRWTTDSKESVMCELVHVKNPHIGKMEREVSRRGLRHATLLELITFLSDYDMDKVGNFPVYTLGDRLRNPAPSQADAWYGFNNKGTIHLRHEKPSGCLPRDARCLGVLIEGII